MTNCLDFRPAETAVEMIVDDAHRLHEGIAGGGADKTEAALAQILRQGARRLGLGEGPQRLGGKPVGAGRGVRLEAPDIGGKAAELGLHLERPLGVVDGRGDLAAVPDDAGIEHQPPMPDAPDPESLPTLQDRIDATPEVPDFFRSRMSRPIDIRHVDDPPWQQRYKGPRSAQHRVWMRADGVLPDDPLLHVCVLTFASDMTLLDTVLLSHDIGRHASAVQPQRHVRHIGGLANLVPGPLQQGTPAGQPPLLITDRNEGRAGEIESVADLAATLQRHGQIEEYPVF